MSSTFFRFLRYARRYWLLIGGAILLGILKFSLALAMPIGLGLVIDTIAGETLETGEALARILSVLGILLVAMLLRTPITYFRSTLAVRAGQRTIFDLRKDLFRHIQRLSLSYHHGRRTGSTLARLINDLNECQGILDHGVIAIAMDITFLCGTAVFLFIQDWRLALASLFTLPIYGIVFAKLNPKLRRVAVQVQSEMEELSGEAAEKLSGIQVVQSFSRERTEALNFFKRHRRYFDMLMGRVRLRMTLISVAEFLQGVGPVVIVGYGGYRVLQGVMTPGELVTFYGVVQHLYLPMRRLADYSAVLQEKLAAVDRVFELMDHEPDIADEPGARDLKACEGRITFEDVRFGYDDEEVLKGLSFEAAPGQSVAIVGRSGAGKSTLVGLVPRFYDVWSGAVRIDGVDVREISVQSLRQQVGMVLQETVLFSGTIAENILYGRQNASHEEMVRAAEMAHADEFIRTLPHGYETPIGERGVSLSGGQRQRLSIARAFLRDPRILILDEATSSLDSRAESIIQDALNELMRGRTTLVIAHRLSTIVDCDKVLVMKEGRLVEEGRHEELVQREGLYRQLCQEQFGGVGLEAIAG